MLHFSNPNVLPFSCYIIQSVFHMVKIFYWRKQVVKVNLSHTLNMFIKSIGSFLETLQKTFFSKNITIHRNFNPFVQKCYLHFFTFFEKQKISKLQNIVSFVLIKILSPEKVQICFWTSNFSTKQMVNTCWLLVNTSYILENMHKVKVSFLDV